MLTCRDMAEVVTEYHEGTLPWWRYPLYLLHALVCPPCRNYRETMAQAPEVARAAQEAEGAAAPAPEVPPELLEALRREGE